MAYKKVFKNDAEKRRHIKNHLQKIQRIRHAQATLLIVACLITALSRKFHNDPLPMLLAFFGVGILNLYALSKSTCPICGAAFWQRKYIMWPETCPNCGEHLDW